MPIRSKPLSSGQKRRHIDWIRLLRKAFAACTTRGDDNSFLQGSADINPHYDRTGAGLAICFSGNTTHRLWTPWGSTAAGYAASGGVDLEQFRSRLGLTVKPLGNGLLGDVYGIRAIDDIALPFVALPRPGATFDYARLTAEWVELNATAAATA